MFSQSVIRCLRALVIPRNSKQEQIVRALLYRYSVINSLLLRRYKKWIWQNEREANRLAQKNGDLEHGKPLPPISVILSVSRPFLPALNAAIESLFKQSYPNWELWIVNHDSTGEIASSLDFWAAKEPRVRVVHLQNNTGIDGDSKHILQIVKGAWIALINQSDTLAPFALHELTAALQRFPATDLFYFDEDILAPEGNHRKTPFFKPALAPDYLRSCNYLGNFLAIRRELAERVGWLQADFGGAEMYDLVLRAVEAAAWVTHIPQVLSHRLGENVHAEKNTSETVKAGWRALVEHLQRTGIPGEVVKGSVPGTYRVKYALTSRPLISIVIPNHDHAPELRRCVDSICNKSTYSNYEILIVENNSHDDDIFTLYRELQGGAHICLLECHQTSFNYSEINNFAIKQAHGEIVLFLNNDVEVITPDWLEQMLAYAQRGDVGVVGAKLYFPDGTLQHVGVVAGMHGTAGHPYSNFPHDYPGYHNNALLPQNYSAVTAACMMMRKNVFDEIGGFDSAYQLSYGDIDLCLKLREQDYLIVWTPYAELYHYESLTRGYDNDTTQQKRLQREADLFCARWKHVLDAGDPYYNPNLALDHSYYSLRPGKCDQTPRMVKGLARK